MKLTAVKAASVVDETLPRARVFEWHKDWRQRQMMRNPPVHPPRTLPKALSNFEIFATQSLNCRSNVVRGAERQQDGLFAGENRVAQSCFAGRLFCNSCTIFGSWRQERHILLFIIAAD